MAIPFNQNRFLPYQPINQYQAGTGYGQIPVNRGVDQNMFGQNIQLPNAPPKRPGIDEPIDFPRMYEEAMGRRPNRLAYQTAVNEGPPQLERGKMDKIMAILAGVGTTMKTGDPVAGYNLGMSSYYAPEQRAKEQYREKLANLSQAAGFEQEEKADEIKKLEFQYNDFFKRKAEERAQAENVRQNKTTEAQIQNWKDDNEAQNWKVREDPKTGISYIYNWKTGIEKKIGQTSPSSEESIAEAVKKVVAEETAKDPFKIAQDRRDQANRLEQIREQNKGSLAVAQEGTDRALGVQEMKSEDARNKAAARIREKANALPKADEIYKNMLLAVAVEVSEGRLPTNAASYISNVGGVPTADRGFAFTDEAKATEAAVQNFIGAYIKKAQTPPPAPGPANQSAGAGGITKLTTQDGKEIDPASVPRNKHDGSVTITSPDGKQEQNVSFESLQFWLSKGAKIKGRK